MALVQVVFQGPGPLPVEAKFNAEGDGVVVFYLAATAYSTTAGNLLTVELVVDGEVIGAASTYTNEAESHKAILPIFIPYPLTAGTHIISLQVNGENVVADGNDYFNVTVFY